METVCQLCGTPINTAGQCPKCLLDSACFEMGQSEAERLFQAALSFPETGRTEFVKKGAGGNPEILAEAEMLLAAFSADGGDSALATIGNAASARAELASAGGEEPGTRIGHFTLERRIGEGGMGTVWEARQTGDVERSVALKVIKLGMDTREVVARFERERQVLATLKHPNIAHVYEAGVTELGRPFFAMELIDGNPIDAFCLAGALGLRERVLLFLDVCSAVEHAHQKGVIHRDIKPSNVLVGADGIAKVIDFGVAKATREEADPLFTKQAQVIGTPAYMSPEQALSDGTDIDTRSDVYSLGAVLYELLCGRQPFDPQRLASTGIAEMQKILSEEVPPLPSTRVRSAIAVSHKDTVRTPNIDRDLDWIVMKALSKERERRYSGAQALADDLRRYLDGDAVSAVPPTLGYRFGKFASKNRTAVGAVAAVMIALMTALAVSLRQVQRTNLALEGEAVARHQATMNIADLYTNNGISAHEQGDPATAALWFAKATLAAENDADRRAANSLRAAVWRDSFRKTVRAFDTGENYVEHLRWNPAHPALLVWISEQHYDQIWEIGDSPKRWEPELGKIKLAAWGPRGERLLVTTKSAVHVVAYPSGETLSTIENSGVATLAWHPDGETVATGGGDGLLLWKLDSGETSRSLGGDSFVNHIEFSRDGKWLLVQKEAATEVRSARDSFAVSQVQKLTSKRIPSHFLGDGSTLVVGTEDGRLTIYRSETGQEIRHFPGSPPKPGWHAETWSSPDGNFVIRKGGSMIDLSSGRVMAGPVATNWRSASFTSDGKFVAAGTEMESLQLWSLPEGRLVAEIGDPGYAVLSAETSPNGRFLASSEQGRVRVWDLRLPDAAQTIELPENAPSLVTMSPDRSVFVPSGFTRQGASLTRTRAIDVVTGAPAGPWMETDGLLMDAGFQTRTGEWIALAVSTTADRSTEMMQNNRGTGNIQLWDHRRGERLGNEITVPSEPRGVSVHPAGDRIGVWCAGGEALEIDVATRTVTKLFQHPQPDSRNGAVSNNGRCNYSPDGNVFAVWGPYETHVLWHCVKKRHLIEPYRDDVTVFDIDFAADVVANTVVTQNMRLEFRDSSTGRALTEPAPYTNWPMLGRLSDDGNLLLAGGGDFSAQVLDWRKGTTAGPSRAHREGVFAGTFLPGKPWVATGDTSGQIQIWNYQNGRQLRPAITLSSPIYDLSIGGDGRFLIASGHLGIVRIDLDAALPKRTLSPDARMLLAEIDANRTVFEGGGLQRLGAAEWFAKWRQFRKSHPEFHQLSE